MNQKIWTIGHSTRTLNEFTALLKEFSIEVLADVRRFPGSSKFPHFNKESLALSLEAHNIQYMHMLSLGGRRRVSNTSHSTPWRNKAFQAYADYMQTEEFKKGIEELTAVANNKRTAIMCSEALWWRCHRSLISDYLKVKGWEVIHIMGEHKSQEHPFTSPARVVQGRLDYGEN